MRGYTIAEIDERLYGSFLEHLGRAVYTGIYEPGHPTADENGMRGDVARPREGPQHARLPLSRRQLRLGLQLGRRHRAEGERPTRLDLAWHTSETNDVGIHEFADWCETAGTEMMLAVNLGSRGLDEARNFVEYVNHPGGSYWGDLRKKNGRTEPWNVKLWCLGNEMDGPWQVGHKTADEYGHLANETAKALRAFDRALELVVCGSSNADMPTYPAVGGDGARARPTTRSTTSRCTCTSPTTTKNTAELPRAEREARPLHRHRRRRSSTT